MQPMTRRAFLKLSGGMAVGVAVAAEGGLLASSWTAPALVPSAVVASELAVARGSDYARMLAAALETLGGSSVLAGPGDHVVLKPTLAWNRPAHLAANTNPLVVQALARLCLDAGARAVTIFDRTSFRADLCYVNSGLAAALAELRAPQVRLATLTPADFVAGPDGGWRLCRYALEADRLVNVPQAKHHARRGLALGAANLLGAAGGGDVLSDDYLVWILDSLHPDLTVLDATRLLLRNGPAGGDPADVEQRDTLVVSRDPLAADSFGSGLFGRDWRELTYLSLAAAAGLGEPDPRRAHVREV